MYDIPYSAPISQFVDEKTDIFWEKIGISIFWKKNTFMLSRFSDLIYLNRGAQQKYRLFRFFTRGFTFMSNGVEQF